MDAREKRMADAFDMMGATLQFWADQVHGHVTDGPESYRFWYCGDKLFIEHVDSGRVKYASRAGELGDAPSRGSV